MVQSSIGNTCFARFVLKYCTIFNGTSTGNGVENTLDCQVRMARVLLVGCIEGEEGLHGSRARVFQDITK